MKWLFWLNMYLNFTQICIIQKYLYMLTNLALPSPFLHLNSPEGLLLSAAFMCAWFLSRTSILKKNIAPSIFNSKENLIITYFGLFLSLVGILYPTLFSKVLTVYTHQFSMLEFKFETHHTSMSQSKCVYPCKNLESCSSSLSHLQ